MRPNKHNRELHFFKVASTCTDQLNVLAIVTPNSFSLFEIFIGVVFIIIPEYKTVFEWTRQTLPLF